MRPQIGDLAIAKFDGDDGRKYHEVVCLVVGRKCSNLTGKHNASNEFEFIYADERKTSRSPVAIFRDALPQNRLRAVVPKVPNSSRSGRWNLANLTPNKMRDI